MKRSIFTKVFFLGALISAMVFKSLVAQDLTSAILLTRSELYDKSGEMLQQLIQKEPSNSKYYFFLGENYLLDYFADTISNSLVIFTNNAKAQYQKGVNANPNDPLNYVGLAKVAFFLDDNKTADEMRAKARSLLLPYKNIKKIVPPAKEYAFALAKIAESYIKEGTVDTSKALPLIREAIKIDSKNADVYLVAGDVYMIISDGSTAIKNYNMAQFYDPKSPTANMKAGYVYVKGRALSSAIPKFEEAISLDPNYAPAYRELGQVYWLANRLEQSKENFKKYLELTQGNIPAKTRYINSLFFAGDYDEVIKNVEEVLAVDKSRSYMNRLAGYSSYDKKNPDYAKALTYMDELFKTVSAERILWKDHYYTARILMKKNLGYAKQVDELGTLEAQLQKDNSKYNAASAAEKTKLKPALDELASKTNKLRTDVAASKKEIDRGFQEYNQVLTYRPQDRAIMSEMATYYSSFKMYDQLAKTMAKLIDPTNFDPEAYMRVGRAFYNGEKFKSADSVFNIVLQKDPNYLPAHIQVARTYSRIEKSITEGLAKPKFEKVISTASKDSLKNSSELAEALVYLGYYNMEKGDYNKAKELYNRLVNIDPNNKDNKIKGYNGIGQVELRIASAEKVNEARLPILTRASDAFNKILALDPNNASAKSQINWVRDFEASVKKGINPNEIKGVIKDAATGTPVAYVIVKVKDTAAETMTNAKGEYKFEIPPSSETLQVSAKGYQSQEIAVTKSRVYNVSLSK